MHADVRVGRARGDGERVPLEVANIGAVEEEPLSGLVVHAGLAELYFYDICGDGN